MSLPFSHKFLRRLDQSNQFLELNKLIGLCKSKQLIWFGEYHGEKRICSLLEQLIKNLGSSSSLSRPETTITHLPQCPRKKKNDNELHIILEHFSLDMQELLNRFMQKEVTWEEFIEIYKDPECYGTENHNLEPYREILSYCRNSSNIHLHGGFVPRDAARVYMKSNNNTERGKFLADLIEKSYLPPVEAIVWMEQNMDHCSRTKFPTLVSKKIENTVTENVTEEVLSLFSSSSHFSLFESLMSGRDVYSGKDNFSEGSYAKLSKMFQAQLLKDWSLAWKVHTTINKFASKKESLSKTNTASHINPHFLVIAGRGHVQHYLGAPGVFNWLSKWQASTRSAGDRINTILPEANVTNELLLVSQMMYEIEEIEDCKDDSEKLVTSNLVSNCMQLNGIKNDFEHPLADVLYVYDEEDWEDESSSDDEGSDDNQVDDEVVAKVETAAAYNKVGSTAYLPGNVKKAKAIMTHLRYTDEEQKVVGLSDLYNYQGVSNPFLVTRPKVGESVLDMGSGLGVDSFLAAYYVGSEGKVIGLDLAKKQVAYANKRAKERPIETEMAFNNVSFMQGDIEKLFDTKKDDLAIMPNGKEKSAIETINRTNITPAMFDLVISNGAFCLAPDKTKAFTSVFKALKPGGRMAICTSTIKENLDNETHWPVCMRMFERLDRLKPMCEEIGFKNVRIDMRNSEMEFDMPEEEIIEKELEENKKSRNKVHVGSVEFKHLQSLDMNEICAVVTVYGEK